MEGLVAAGDLDGPGIELPIHLETAPGHKFTLPGLSQEGVYYLRNIRLMKGTEFVQSATPSIATITVSNLLQTSVKVRQLTVEELRARGIPIDARNFDVFEYTFSFFIDGKEVDIPYPVVIDKRTREVHPAPGGSEFIIPPVGNVAPPRWNPPAIEGFGLGDDPQDDRKDQGDLGRGGGPARPSIPAALVIPNNLAVLHQFFAVTLMVTNGAPEGSSVTIDGITAMIRTPTELRVVKSVPASGFNLPVPVVDATHGVTFLVAQAKGNVDWTIEGLRPGTHTLEVEVRATYKAPGQNDFPLKGTVRASIVVHDPRFSITFSHPDTVRKGIDYSTYTFVTNMSPVAQTIRVNSGVQTCAQSPLANICRVDTEPDFIELTIPAGEMRMVEYKLRPSVTGFVFANAGSVEDDHLSAAVQLHMGVSESGIPLSPATLVLPYYARYVNQDLVDANLQLLGLGYSLATAPLTQALASHPQVIKTDVFQRAVDIARAGQHLFLGEETPDALANLTLDLLGNGLELREWDELRRKEKSGRTAGAAVARELQKGATDAGTFVDRFAKVTAWRPPYLLAASKNATLSVKDVATNARMAVASEAAADWVRQLPFGEIDTFLTGELAVVGRWAGNESLGVTPMASGPVSLDVIFPAANAGSVLRGHLDFTGTAGQTLTLLVQQGASVLELRDSLGGIAAIGTITSVAPEPLRLIGARQDLHLDPNAHKVSVLFNRPVTLADGEDWLTKFHGQIALNKDGVNYTGARPISAAALQDGGRVVNLTFDHALSQNATYSLAVDPLRDPLSGAAASFPQPLALVIDNDAPGGIIFGHVLGADGTPIAGADVVLNPLYQAAQYDTSRAGDGSFLFEFIPRDPDRQIYGSYSMIAVTKESKVTSVDGAVRLPGRVHFVNLVFLGRGSAEGYVRYDNGQVVAGARVTVGSTMFQQFQQTETDANGFYRVQDLPVGPLTFSAVDLDGNVAYVASEIKTSGQLLVKDLSIYRRPFPGVGVIRGIVKRSDSGAPVAGAHVGVFSQGYGLIDGFTDSAGTFEFTKVPAGFVTVLASEWNISRQSVALDFDLAPDERRDVVLTLNVTASEALAAIEGDVIRENLLFPGDSGKYQKVAGALVKLEKGQATTADANGHYVLQGVPLSSAGDDITAYDPITTRSATILLPTLTATAVNNVPIFIGAKSGGEGTVRVRVLNAAGGPAFGMRVIEPGLPPIGPTEFTDSGGGVYTLSHVSVGREVKVFAISNGGTYGDQFATGTAKVEFNGHVAALTLRLGGQGTVRVRLQADIAIIGDVDVSYPAWDEALQDVGGKTVTASASANGQPDYAVFQKVPAATQEFVAASVHPVYGYAGQSGKLGFDGDLTNITLQLNKLSTIRGTVYAIDGRTPVPGAAVRLVDGRQDQGLYTTLQDGSFVFFNIPAAAGFTVVADVTQSGVYRTGYASGVTPPAGGPVDNVALILRTQGSIDARVVYSAYKVFDPKNPANNVPDNTPNDLSDNAPVPLARFWMKEIDFPHRDFGTLQDTLGTDVLGRFSFNNLFTGPLRVTAYDPGNQELRGTWSGTLTQEGERLTAIIGIGDAGVGTVAVTVLDPNKANEPVANAEVSLFRSPGGIFDFSTTDAAGHAQFDQLGPGTYSVSAYSKAVGKSGASGTFAVAANGSSDVRVLLEFSGGVTGKLIDTEDHDRGIPGAQVNLAAFNYATRATTGTLGDFVFEGVREGLFTLTAKDTLSNRRATASRNLTQADPHPNITLQLEPTATLNLAVYEPDDAGNISSVLVPLVEATVIQRCVEFVGCDFERAAQGNPIQMAGALAQAPYTVTVKEIGGQHREMTATASFPTGSAATPLKLVFPAYGDVEVRVTQAGAPSSNAKVTITSGTTSATVYTDPAGVALATGIPLGNLFVQASTVDGAFSGSASATLTSRATRAIVSISLGAFAGVTGYVEAEKGGPSAGTRVVAAWPGRSLEMFTDSNGRYVFQGITTGSTVSLVYVGPDDITVGARQSYFVKPSDASQTVTLPPVKLDATPPQLVSFTPADGAQNVSPDTPVQFLFSEPIQAQYVSSAYIQLVPADSSTPVNCAYTSSTNANGTFTVLLTPPPPAPGKPFPLESNTLYRIVVSGEIRDLTGNKLPGTRGAVFTTTDYAQPSVVKVTPPVNTPLSSAVIFQFQFNEPIDPAPWQPGGIGRFHLYKISQPGPSGTIVREIPGRAFVDPQSSLTLIFSPDERIEPQSFYRAVFSGIRDLQGNATPEQTFHFFSFDSIRPFVVLHSPLPDGYPLISGVEYTLTVDLHDTDANGPASVDIARVDYSRVDGTSATFLKSETKAPFSYKFVAPDVPDGGAPFTLRAEALDLSGNTSEPASLTWTVQPNKPPQNVAIALAPSSASYAGNRVSTTVTFDDEGILATVQAVLTATQGDGTPYTKSLVKQVTRTNVTIPWSNAQFDFDLPATLKESTTATFAATVTDARGQATNASAALTIQPDLIKPALLSLAPSAETSYSIGAKYQIEAVVQDLESGVQRVAFNFDGQTVTVLGTDPSVTPGAQPRSWKFVSGQITVPAKNVDTRIPITVSVYDYHGNVFTYTVDVIYVGVNDPTLPKGAWLCPIDRAVLPSNQTALPLTLQVRATDDIAVTGVKFIVPGLAAPLAATRVGTTDVWQAAANVATPAAGTPLQLSAVVSDASTAHDVTLPISITVVDADIVIDDRIQAVTAADVAAYDNKSVLVRGANARLVPHVPLTLKNLLVLQGGRVETLSTTTAAEQRLDLTVTDNLYVDCASSIDVSGRGYLGGWALNPDGSNTRNNDARGRTTGNTSEGGPTTGAGASHGGVGGEATGGVTNAVYGSIVNPTTLGTGGGGAASCCNAGGATIGAGGSGGGAIKLQGGVFAVAGAIRADGDSQIGGEGNPGSGGSINLTARQLITGPSARITANGGDDDGVNNTSRGGGGGRIAVVASERFDVEKLGVQLAARGGRNAISTEAATYLDAGAGTVYVKRPGQTLGELFVGNADERFPSTSHLARFTPVSDSTGTLHFDRVEAGPRALLRADSSLDVGGIVDTRSALTIDPSAAVVFSNDKPTLIATTAPPAGSSLAAGTSLSLTYTATSVAGIGEATMHWTPVTPDRVDSYFSYPTTPVPSSVTLAVPAGTPAGAATLTVKVTDRAGRTTTTAPVSFTIIANATPVITAFDVTPAAVYPGKSVVAAVSATDDLGVTKLTLTSTINNGAPVVQTKTPNTPSVSDSFTVAVPITTPGGAPMTLDLAVEDGFAGRAPTTQTRSVTILTDTVAPSLSVTSPANGTIYQEGSGALIPVRATAVDAEVGVKQVFAQIDGTQYPLTAGSGGSWSADIPVPSVDGVDVVSKQLVVTAKDYEGNPASITIPIQIRPLNDPNAPVVQWACSTSGALAPVGAAAKLRVYALGNNAGNAANGVQKVELFVDNAITPLLATPVSGLANYYETTYTIPAGTADGTQLAVRAVVTNTAGLQNDATTRITAVTGSVITANLSISASDTTYDGKTVIVQSGTLTIAGAHTFTRLVVLGGAKVVHPATDATTIQRLTVTASAVYVACDGSIDATGLGFPGATGGYGRTWPNTTTGGSVNGAGGSHGGRGGQHDANGDSAPAYGSVLDPNEPGGAGGNYYFGTCAACDNGGGIIRLTAGTFVIDGKVLANGVNEQGNGAGAGGSIRLDAGTLSGGGEIHADGGPTGYTAGGGGRIALYYESLTLNRTKITAAGGLHTNSPTRTGAAGTLYLRKVDASKAKLSDELVLDNLDRPALRLTTLPTTGEGTIVSLSGDVLTLSAPVPEFIEGSYIDVGGTSYPITARTATTVTVSGAQTITAGAAYRGLWRFDQVTAQRQGTIEIAGGLQTPLISNTGTGLVRSEFLREQSITVRGRAETGSVTATTLAIQNNGSLGHAPTTGTKINQLTIDVDTLTVDSTSAIDVSGRGFTGVVNGSARTWNNTPTGGSVNGAGGSHGGRGGAYDAIGESAATYGSLFDPDTPGGAGSGYGVASCDPCGTGGGVARIKARTFVLDGKVLSNGLNTGSGGGAGGSIRIDADSLSGAGEIRADGGPTNTAAGGGGRIAVYYRTLTFDKTKITAAGELHVNYPVRTGGAGTVYFRHLDAAGAKLDDELVLDNRDRVASHLTPIATAGSGTVTAISGATVTLSNPVPDWIDGSSIDFLDATGAKLSSYAIVAHTATTVTLDDVRPTVSAGNTYRGVARFDLVTIRGAALASADSIGMPVLTSTSNASIDLKELRGDSLTLRGWVRVTGNVDVTTLALQTGAKLDVDGTVKSTTLTLTGGAVLSQIPTTATSIARLVVDAGTLSVDAASSIDVSGRGLVGTVNGTGRTWPNTVTGGSVNGAGGSHGGRGGQHDGYGDSAPAYGSLLDPNEPGGAGGEYYLSTCDSCNPGGGIARLKATTFVLDGKVLANGLNTGGSGGGAGGAIRVDAQSLTGGGEIHADGGPTVHAAGGGGRIAIYAATLGIDKSKITAAGGLHTNTPTRTGAAGTIYFGTTNELTVDNLDRATAKDTELFSLGSGTVTSVNGATLTLSSPVPEWIEGSWIDVGGTAAQIVSRTPTTVTLSTAIATPGAAYRGQWRFATVGVKRAASLATDVLNTPLLDTSATSLARLGELRGDDVMLRGRVETTSVSTRSLTMQNTALLTHPFTTASNVYRLAVNVQQALSVDATSTIDVSGRGYTGSTNGFGFTWPNTPTNGSSNASGGSHGGRGGQADVAGDSGPTYDSLFDPTLPGAAGALPSPGTCTVCNAGGGVVRIAAGSLALDGKVLANGSQGVNGGSGAGGSIRIDAGAISGAGEIHAEGGVPGYIAGGGGRIALYYDTLTLSLAKIFAPGGLWGGAPSRTGAAGTIYLKQSAQQNGDLIVDNAGRPTTKNTVLPSIGFRTVTQAGTTFVRDASAAFPTPDFLARMRLVINNNKSVTWPIVSNDATTVNVDTTGAPLAAQTGNGFRGLYRFDHTTLRSSRLEVQDLFESVNAIDKDASSALLGSNLPPVLTQSLITLQSSATGSSIIGAAGAALDADQPLVLTATNLASGNTYVVNANVDGSFTIPLQGNTGDAITLKGKDSNYFPLETPLLNLGTLQFGTPPPSFIDQTTWTNDANFHARRLAMDDRNLLVTGGNSDKLVILGLADPGRPAFVRTVTVGNGVINDIAITNGWATIVSNDFALLDLSSPTSTPIVLPDTGNTEVAVTVADGYAYVGTPHVNDGRIRTYDVSTPSNTRFYRDQGMVSGVVFTSILDYGSQYLVAITPDHPNNVGHDVVVIDRTNVYALVKIADFDVPNFDARYGFIDGTRLYLTSATSPDLVVVDLSTPSAPAVLGRKTMPANGGRSGIIGASLFVADSTAGLVEVDVTDPRNPAIANVSPTTGSAYDVKLAAPYAYIASDAGLSVLTLTTPPQIDTTRISLGVAGQTVTVTATALATRNGTTATVENVTGGGAATVAIATDGSFAASVSGLPGDVITLKATSSAGKTSGPVLLGKVPFATGVTQIPFPPSLTGETQYHARTVAADGNWLVVGGAFDGGSTRVLLFDVTNPTQPVYKRTVTLNDGAINQVAIYNGYAFIIANDIVLLDLSNPNSTPIYVPDVGNTENDVVFRDGYAFTVTPHINDGRMRIYDVSSLPTVRFIRDQGTLGGVTFTGIAALGSRYLIGITEQRPGGVGHDVVVVDRGNINNLVKVADLDIPNFDAFRGELVGNTLYLVGTTNGVAIVDLSNPLAPVLKAIVPQGAARGLDAVGSTVFVGNGSAGVTLLDASDPAAPSILGTLDLAGTAWSCAFNRGSLYVATEDGLAVIQNVATGPMVEPSRLAVAPQSATLATVSGSASAVFGLAPLTVAVKNVTTGATVSGTAVAADGSFSVLIPAALSQSLAVQATDKIGRKSGWLPAGSVPFGTSVDTYRIDSVLTGQPGVPYLPRLLATDGRWLIVGGYADGNSTKLLVYDVNNPGLPQLQRVVALNDGSINNLAIRDGWAYVAANDVVLLDLSNPASTPLYVPDVGNTETDLAFSGGYAFTVTPHINDGRIRVYDVSRPTAVRWLRDQSLGLSLAFGGILSVGTNYLIAMTDQKPGGVGHDVVVVDRSDIYNMVKVADLDIPNFDAFRGKIIGNTLYIAGRAGGLAIVDITDPRTPVVVKVMSTAGSTNGVDGYGSLLAVADSGAGVSFLDITTPAGAQLFGTQRIGGNAYSVAFNRGQLYAVNEQGLVVIRDFGAAPTVAASLLSVARNGLTAATVTGAPLTIAGAGALTFEVRNARTGTTTQGPVAANGGFSTSIAAVSGDLLTVEATDEAGRKSGRVYAGTVPFGDVTTIPITPEMSEAGFRPRTLVTDGTYLIVGSYGDSSGRIVIFDVSTPAAPRFIRSLNLNDGIINAVAIQNGWAIVAANDIVTLDLSNPTATPIYVPDVGNTEVSLAVSGGYAFTTTPHINDGRVRVYDVSNPAAPRFVREQVMGIFATTLTAVGTDYLVATTTGHDVVVIDRRNVYALAKLADLDIPSFDGFRGVASGTTLYLGGGTGGLAIIDLSNPKSPVVKTIYKTVGDPLASDVDGSIFAVADSSAGVTFLDLATPFAPQRIGTQATGGTVWATAFGRGVVYAANEQGLVVLTNVVPTLDRSLITVTATSTSSVSITGTARAAAGIAPLTATVRNLRTSASAGPITVGGDGSFTATLAAAANDPLQASVTDAAGRTNVLSLGNVPFGAVVTQLAGPAQANNDAFYRARRIASDGTSTILTTGSTNGLAVTTSGRAVVFRSGSVKSYAAGGGINDVAIANGYAFLAANDFASLNLADPNATPFVAPDAGSTESSVTVMGTYAFTSTPNAADGRVRIYNIANPAQPVFYREQALGLTNVVFTKLLPFGPTYLIGIADGGHDVVLIDASNPSVLVKLVDLDIPNFNAIDGVVEGTTLYLAGGDAGIAVLDFVGTPTAPSFTTAIIDTPGVARGVAVSGPREIAVADGSSGVTFIDATTRTAPVILGTQPLGATNVVGVCAVGRTVYAAADSWFHTISRP